MRLGHVFVCGIIGALFAGGNLFAADGNDAGGAATSPAVYAPATAHQNDPLPDGVITWNSLVQETTVAANVENAHFNVSFTNISSGKISILDVHPSCGCTTVQLPAMPWTVAPGSSGQFGLTVNIVGKTGMLFKTVTVKTDQGYKQLVLKINIQPPVIPSQTPDQRQQAMALAKTDRQAVFHGDCAACHVKPGDGKYGKPLYYAVCAICHESKDRASMVPDLHAIKTPTNVEFWQTWIAHGKAGSLMPAFSTSDGGPLSDMQIMSLAQYLNTITALRSVPAFNQ